MLVSVSVSNRAWDNLASLGRELGIIQHRTHQRGMGHLLTSLAVAASKNGWHDRRPEELRSFHLWRAPMDGTRHHQRQLSLPDATYQALLDASYTYHISNERRYDSANNPNSRVAAVIEAIGQGYLTPNATVEAAA